MTVRCARTRQYPWRSVAPLCTVIGGFGRGLAANKHKFLNKFRYEYISCLDYEKGWKKSEKNAKKKYPKTERESWGRPTEHGYFRRARVGTDESRRLARTRTDKKLGSRGLGDLTSKGIYCQRTSNLLDHSPNRAV
jgi:hypothetical protein